MFTQRPEFFADPTASALVHHERDPTPFGDAILQGSRRGVKKARATPIQAKEQRYKKICLFKKNKCTLGKIN
jgi:hypothetical protein